MIKKMFVLFICLVVSGVSVSQEKNEKISFGIKAGTNFSKYKWEFDRGLNAADFQIGTGYYFGVFSKISLSKRFEIQPELFFSQHKSVLEINLIPGTPQIPSRLVQKEQNVSESRIALPILLRWNPVKNLYLLAGAQITYRFTIEDDFNPLLNGGFRISDADKFGYQAVTRTGYSFTKYLSLELGYVFGLNYQDNFRLSAFQMGLAYRL